MATTSLSHAYRDTHLHYSHIVPLDFSAVEDLPESHTWTTAHPTRAADHPGGGGLPAAVPTIDLRSPSAAALVGDACRDWGMFQVTNHGVPAGLVEDVEAHARRLFELPAEQKLKAVRAPNGATGYGVARISPFFTKLMWHEGFTIMAGSAVEHAKLLWPLQYQEFCDAMDNYQKKMKSLAYKLFLIILKSLGYDENNQETSLLSASLNQSQGALQLNSYPSCPNPSRAIGLAPHTDSLLLTILHQNDTNGLQIFREGGVGWVPVTPLKGALVINVGDLMHILSNGCFPTVYHRVVPNETRRHRFSVAYFYGPPADSTVAPLAVVGRQFPRFRAVTVREYIGLKNKHLEKAIGLIKI
ncbi:hypothetical protein ACP275_01G029300 [Erythranthe tilingii]